MKSAAKRVRAGAGVPRPHPVDRTTARWLRLRSVCRFASPDVNLDEHADAVWLVVESFLARGAR